MKGPKWFLKLLKQQPPANQQPVPEPAPSYFDPPKEDEPARKRPARSSSDIRSTGKVNRSDPSDKPKAWTKQAGDAKGAFDTATDAAAIKAQDEFDRRFTSEATREAALDAREAAQALREQVIEQYEAKAEKIERDTDRITMNSMPWPQFATSENNKDRIANREWKKNRFAEIDRQLEISLAQIAVLDAVVGPLFGKPILIGTTHVTKPTADFNPAAGNPVPAAEPEAAEPDTDAPIVTAETHEAAEEPAAERADWLTEVFNRAMPPTDEQRKIKP